LIVLLQETAEQVTYTLFPTLAHKAVSESRDGFVDIARVLGAPIRL